MAALDGAVSAQADRDETVVAEALDQAKTFADTVRLAEFGAQ